VFYIDQLKNITNFKKKIALLLHVTKRNKVVELEINEGNKKDEIIQSEYI